MRAPTLMYHDVIGADGVRGGFDGSGPAVYAVTEKRFHDHLDAVGRAVARRPSKATALLDGGAPAGSWMITFDDGGSSAVAAGAELARRGWQGHFFVVTDLVGTAGFVDWEDVRGLHEQGHLIGSHSASHPSLISACSPQQLADEWARSADALADCTGVPTLAASVPGGYYSRAVGRAAAAAGIRWLFTSEPIAEARAADGCTLIGRYAIRSTTAAPRAARAAAGDRRQWLSQRAAWELRGLAKRVGGRHYQRLRHAVLDRR